MIKKSDLDYYINDEFKDTSEFVEFLCENDLNEYGDCFIHTDYINDELKNILDKGYWDNVKYMLEDIENTNDEYFYKDGYGNYRNVKREDIKEIASDIKTYIEKYPEEYEL